MSTPPLDPLGTPGSSVGDVLENAIELKEVEGLSQGQIVRRRFLRHRGAMGGMLVLLGVMLLAFTSTGVLGYDGWWHYDHTDQSDVVNGSRPSMGLPVWLGGEGFAIGDHPFGQDHLGRDNFAMVMEGVQTSIKVMVVLALVSSTLGVVVGALAGFYRGWIDQLLMRMTDLVITFPVLVIGAVLGKMVQDSGPFLLALALGLIVWTQMARLVRAEFLALREREFVDAARVAGASDLRIMFKHILPNAMGVIIVNTTLIMALAVLLETSLSYLEFGINWPDVSLGWIIGQYDSAFSTRPWLYWWPALFIVLIALCVNFIGDGLRDAFDPRQKKVPSERTMRRAQARAEKKVG